MTDKEIEKEIIAIIKLSESQLIKIKQLMSRIDEKSDQYKILEVMRDNCQRNLNSSKKNFGFDIQ